jgi:predicted homoserine dehydrogenase-like protein
MHEIDRKLEMLERGGEPIGVALIGAGQMGKDIAAQIGKMAGMRLVAAVDLDAGAAAEAYRHSDRRADVALTDDEDEAEKAARSGRCIATANYRAAVRLSGVRCVIDATGSPEMGARTAMECVFFKKHIVMMSVECDVTVGPILRLLCERAGVVYSLAAGDEPGAIVELWRFARALGFKIVAAGKGKNNPLDIYANPGQEEWAQKAAQRQMNPRMLVEFVDGSKTMVEMAAVSNATGLLPDVRGMHGPKCDTKDLARVFSLKSQGGILSREGAVDYGIGDINPGVFVVVSTDSRRIIEGLAQRDMGNGPNYLLFRPYHLCSIETPLSAAQAVIYGESTAHPMRRLASECITVAKRDLKAGETLDGIGGHCYRASIETRAAAKGAGLLPVGLANGATLTRDVAKDEAIALGAVALPEDSVLLQLRRMQDQLLD